MPKLWAKGMKWLFSHQMIFKSSRAPTKQSRSDSHFTARNFLKNIRSYWVEHDKIRIIGSINVQTVTCNNGYTIQVFKHSDCEKVAEFYYRTDESVKSATSGCILFTAILLILECMRFCRFAVDIFDAVFLFFFKCKN